MAFKTITVTVDDKVGLDSKDIAGLIYRHVRHMSNPAVEITTTPDTIDVRFEKVFTDIELSAAFMASIKKGMRGKIRKQHLTSEELESILMAGAKKYGL